MRFDENETFDDKKYIVIDNYVNAVNNCGGIAVPQYCPEVSTEYDGLILCEGNDIDPAYYNEKVNGAINIDPKRDVTDFAFVKAFAEKRKPIFGICRGCQLLNVAFGGSLYQDISNAGEHRPGGDCRLVHNVIVKKDSFLYNMYGREFSVNSFHHQAIKTVGNGLDVVATTPDGGTIEGIMHKELPIFVVQWHPKKCVLRVKQMMLLMVHQFLNILFGFVKKEKVLMKVLE